jgi:predicted transglutaminase-like cysteine proteinase
MPIRRRARSAARAVFIALSFAIAVAGACEVGAKPRTKNPSRAERPWVVATATPDLPAPTPATTSAASTPVQLAPARFFTINEVLAKKNGRAASSALIRLAAVDAASTATDAGGAAESPPVGSDEPFGLLTFRAPEGRLWVKWRKLEADIRAEAVVLGRCRAEPDRCPSPAATQFLALIANARQHEGRARIEFVNQAVNSAIHYMSDLAQHGVPDLWSAPLASFAAGRGDCEDYAIAKYVALRESGTPADDLRLLLVRDNAVRTDHAVLAVRHEGRWLILDNRRMALLEQSEIGHFMLLFALDHNGVKLLAAPYAQRPANESEITLAPINGRGEAAVPTEWLASGGAGGSKLPFLL